MHLATGPVLIAQCSVHHALERDFNHDLKLFNGGAIASRPYIETRHQDERVTQDGQVITSVVAKMIRYSDTYIYQISEIIYSYVHTCAKQQR